jgi:hypothetical protein
MSVDQANGVARLDQVIVDETTNLPTAIGVLTHHLASATHALAPDVVSMELHIDGAGAHVKFYAYRHQRPPAER